MTVERDKLVSELHTSMKVSKKIRDKIDAIDFKEREKKRRSIIGYYFALKSRKEDKRNSGYFHCTGYDLQGYSPVGTWINVYGRGKSKSMEVRIKANGFEDWIENGNKIRPSVFNKLMKEAASKILKEIVAERSQYINKTKTHGT